MIRTGIVLVGLALTGGAASAQLSPPNAAAASPYPSRLTASPFAPNFYNRQSQPISPYMNLFRGADPVTNFYYGVRPGLQSGGSQASLSQVPTQASQLRVGFLPAAANPTQEPTEQQTAGTPVDSLPPASHPVMFQAGSMANRMNAAGGARSGVFGAKPPPSYGKKTGGSKK